MTTPIETLAEAYWEDALRASPRWATLVGDHRYDDRFEDLSLGAKATERARLEKLLVAIEEASGDPLTQGALRFQVECDRDLLACNLDEWNLDPYEGPHVAVLEETSPGRVAAAPGYLDAHIANLRRGAASGRFATRSAVAIALSQLDERPVFAPLRAFLTQEILPHARGPETPGLVHVPGGLDAYKKLVWIHTSLDVTPEELHQLGLREVGKIDVAELRAAVAKAEPFESSEAILACAKACVERAARVSPTLFGRLPVRECRVEPMAPHEEETSGAGYYLDGAYRVNLSRPATRRRFEAEALAFHEAIPGHHIQLALAEELTALPAFRRHASFTAYVEGWALYAERLADEAGLYSDELARAGMRAFDAWRSARLVVDTGLHALGWSRDQAAKFLQENTLLDATTIEEEIDRSVICPGQMLAYAVGKLELFALRAEEEQRLDARFDRRAFHDLVLGAGPLPLPLLRERIRART